VTKLWITPIFNSNKKIDKQKKGYINCEKKNRVKLIDEIKEEEKEINKTQIVEKKRRNKDGYIFYFAKFKNQIFNKKKQQNISFLVRCRCCSVQK